MNDLVGNKRQREDLQAPKRRKRPCTNATYSTVSLSEASSASELIKLHESSFYLWTANDDLLLKEGMQNIGDYASIAKGVKFSYKFTKEEIEARWTAILFHPIHSREAAKRMSKLPILNKRVLWNEWEEEILRYEVVVNHQFQFQHVLEKYRSQFHSSRTAKSLEAHYYRMKRSHNLELADPVRIPLPSPVPSISNPSREEIRRFNSKNTGGRYSGHGLANTNNISPAEIERVGIAGEAMPPIENEYEEIKSPEEVSKVKKAYFHKVLREKEELELLEETFMMYSCLQMKDNYALLRGRHTERSKIGVDLSQEGRTVKISRKQAIIVMTSPGIFEINNVGKASIFINGKPTTRNQPKPLPNNCFLEIGELKFVFAINKLLFAKNLGEENENYIDAFDDEDSNTDECPIEVPNENLEFGSKLEESEGAKISELDAVLDSEPPSLSNEEIFPNDESQEIQMDTKSQPLGWNGTGLGNSEKNDTIMNGEQRDEESSMDN